MIEQILVILVSGCLSGLLGFLGATFALKKYANQQLILNIFQDLVDYVVGTEDMQKKIFAIGALVGQGVKTGVGLNVKGGKMKWEDLAMQVAGQWIQRGGFNWGTPAPNPASKPSDSLETPIGKP